MTHHSSDTKAKKVKYIASIVYLLIFTFIVGGSYINQQMSSDVQVSTNLESK